MDIRCKECNKLLGKIVGQYEIKCPRCGIINQNTKKESVEDEKNVCSMSNN